VPGGGGEKGEGEAESKAGEEERRASRAAAARRGPEPRPRNSEPDLIGAWRRELERGGHSAGRLRDARERKSGRGGPRTASAASQRPAEPSARPRLRRPRPRSGPRPTTTPRVASPSGASPSSTPPPPPPRPGRHSLREGGAARGLRVTYVDVLRHHAGRGRTRSANPCEAWPRPWGPVRRGGGREPPRGGFGAPRAALRRLPWALLRLLPVEQGSLSTGKAEALATLRSGSQPAPTGPVAALPIANSRWNTGSAARDAYIPRPRPAPPPFRSGGGPLPLPSWRRGLVPFFPRSLVPWRSCSGTQAAPRSPSSPPRQGRSDDQLGVPPTHLRPGLGGRGDEQAPAPGISISLSVPDVCPAVAARACRLTNPVSLQRSSCDSFIPALRTRP
jgi:hypothetical protein